MVAARGVDEHQLDRPELVQRHGQRSYFEFAMQPHGQRDVIDRQPGIELVGVEVVTALKWSLPVLLLALLLGGSGWTLSRLGAALPVLAGLLAGTVLVPVLLPWIPGRAFSFKGALVGAIAVGATIYFGLSTSLTVGVAQQAARLLVERGLP